jgi:peptide/nickel transport system ATP-binding protein
LTSDPDVLLRVDNLKRHYGGGRGLFSTAHTIRAVDEVSLYIRRGETLGLVGESGCGKTTTGRMIAGLEVPNGGSIEFDGADVSRLTPRQWREKRRDIQVVFQNPQSALDPRVTIAGQIREPLDLHDIGARAERGAVVDDLMASVELGPELKDRYPHQISGGQAQRVVIARALALEPKLIICDEPVSALDVSVQSRVMTLLFDLQDRLGFAYLFISHDLRVVKKLSHRVAVMYLGEIVEDGVTEEVYGNRRHPYTMALISAIPPSMPNQPRDRMALGGDPPSAVNMPTGCRFHPRCPFARERCRREHPELRPVGNGDHRVRCHYTEELGGLS